MHTFDRQTDRNLIARLRLHSMQHDNKTEIKQICFRFVSDEIVLFQLYLSAS